MLNQRVAIAIPIQKFRITIWFFAVCCHEVGPSALQVASEITQNDVNRVMPGAGELFGGNELLYGLVDHPSVRRDGVPHCV